MENKEEEPVYKKLKKDSEKTTKHSPLFGEDEPKSRPNNPVGATLYASICSTPDVKNKKRLRLPQVSAAKRRVPCSVGGRSGLDDLIPSEVLDSIPDILRVEEILPKKQNRNDNQDYYYIPAPEPDE